MGEERSIADVANAAAEEIAEEALEQRATEYGEGTGLAIIPSSFLAGGPCPPRPPPLLMPPSINLLPPDPNLLHIISNHIRPDIPPGDAIIFPPHRKTIQF